jgi:Na+-driven multidrug efflux pump
MLAAYGLADLTVKLTTQQPLLGLNSTQETFVSQAAGAQEYDSCVAILNRGRFIFFVAFLPMVILLLFSDKILIAIKQDEETSEFSMTFTRLIIIALVFRMLFDI